MDGVCSGWFLHRLAAQKCLEIDGNAVHLLSRPRVQVFISMVNSARGRMNVLYPEGDAESTAGPSVELLI